MPSLGLLFIRTVSIGCALILFIFILFLNIKHASHWKRRWCGKDWRQKEKGWQRVTWLDGIINSMDMLLLLSRFSRVRLCATPETAAHQAPPSLGFPRQEHWSGLPFPSPARESERWKWSHLVVSDSSRLHGLQPTRLLCLWDFPGKSTGVGCHCLLCNGHEFEQTPGDSGGQRSLAGYYPCGCKESNMKNSNNNYDSLVPWFLIGHTE